MLPLLLLWLGYPGANCMAHAHKVSRQVHKPNMLCVCHGMCGWQWVVGCGSYMVHAPYTSRTLGGTASYTQEDDVGLSVELFAPRPE